MDPCNFLPELKKHDDEFKNYLKTIREEADREMAELTKVEKLIVSRDFLKAIEIVRGIARDENSEQDENLNTMNIVKIKQEKMSMSPNNSNSVNDKVNMNKSSEKMPAPDIIPVQKKQKTRASKRKNGGSVSEEPSVPCLRVTRSKTQQQENNKTVVDSGSQELQTSRRTRATKRFKIDFTTVSTVPDVAATEPPPETRSTRTKTIKKEKQTENLPVIELTQPLDGQDNTSACTLYEDALTNVEGAKKHNETYAVLLDATRNLSLQNQQTVNGANGNDEQVNEATFNVHNVDQAILTDDESFEIITAKANPSKLKQKIQPKPPVMLKAGVKNKVEAFEKLGNAYGLKIGDATKKNMIVNSKSKFLTPVSKNFKPTETSTAVVSKLMPKNPVSDSTISNNDRSVGMKSLLEKQGAIPKKNALLQATSEKKKQANLEKQLKAQQQRKLLEAEKQRHLKEQQLLKEQRLKQIEKERLELIKKKEMEKRRLLLQKQQAEEQKKQPIYLAEPLPKLPTTDCYDSDDSDHGSIIVPTWCTERHLLRKAQIVAFSSGKKLKNSFFTRQVELPDVKEIFEKIDARRLKRSSSIYWHKPPRYTMVDEINQTRFSEEESDCE